MLAKNMDHINIFNCLKNEIYSNKLTTIIVAAYAIKLFKYAHMLVMALKKVFIVSFD